MSGQKTKYNLTTAENAWRHCGDFSCENVCVFPETFCYLWALCAGAFTLLVLRHNTCSHLHTSLSNYVNINTEILCSNRGSIAWKVRGKVAYICHQRGVTWTTALHLAPESVGACMATQKGKVLRNGWRERRERVTQLKGTLEWRRGRSWTNAGHLCTTEKSVHTHTTHSKSGGKEWKKHIYMHKHNPILLYSFLHHNPAFFIPLSRSKLFPNKQADLTSIMERGVSPYLTYRDAYSAVTF